MRCVVPGINVACCVLLLGRRVVLPHCLLVCGHTASRVSAHSACSLCQTGQLVQPADRAAALRIPCNIIFTLLSLPQRTAGSIR